MQDKKNNVERISAYVTNLKIITNNVANKMRYIKELLKQGDSTSEALDEIDTVMDILNNVTEEKDYLVDESKELEYAIARIANLEEKIGKTTDASKITKFLERKKEYEVDKTYYEELAKLQKAVIELENNEDKDGKDAKKSKMDPAARAAAITKAIGEVRKHIETKKTKSTAASESDTLSKSEEKYKNELLSILKPEELKKLASQTFIASKTLAAPFKTEFSELFKADVLLDSMILDKIKTEPDSDLSKNTKLKAQQLLGIVRKINPIIQASFNDGIEKQQVDDMMKKLENHVDLENRIKKGGKTRKSSPFNMMKYVSNMMPQRKTQKKRHRKH
jgi:hypothetical protein